MHFPIQADSADALFIVCSRPGEYIEVGEELPMKKTARIPFAGRQLERPGMLLRLFQPQRRGLSYFASLHHGWVQARLRKAIHVVNPGQQAEHFNRLAAAGGDTDTARQRGQLEVQADAEADIRNGRFEQERMLESFEQLAAAAPKTVFPSLALSAKWTGPLKSGLTSRTLSSSNRG